MRKLLEATDGEVLATPAEVAAVLRVERAYVYSHREELGGRPLHQGKKAPLRFNVWALASRLVPDREHTPQSQPQRRTRPKHQRSAHQLDVDDLLPVRDRFASARVRGEAA